MRNARLRLVLGILGAALGVYAIALGIWEPDALTLPAAVHVTIGWSFVGAGVVAWVRRPDNRTGALMTLTGIAWFGRDFDWWHASVPTHVSDLSFNMVLALLAHQVIVFPYGTARSTGERFFVASAYVLAVGGYIVGNLFNDPASHGCIVDCPANLLLVHDSRRLDDITNGVLTALAAAVLVAAFALLARHWRIATVPGRRALAPVVWAGPPVLAVVIVTVVHDNLSDSPPLESLFGWAPLVFVAIPGAFLVGLLRTRLHQAMLGDLVVEFSELPSPARLQAALTRTLGDPSLEVAFWLPDQQRYVGVDGRPLQLPAGDGRAVTTLDRGGQPTAALIYDPSLLDDRALVAGATAAARLALDNARLQAELLAQLAEVRASRARIVEAGDAERRRLERDLHDGAQQRLLGIRLSLRLARGRLADPNQDTEELLTEAEAELESTLEELRALARGIHPAVLTDEGLTPALEMLARRAPFPVTIDAAPTGRLPAPVEAAAYFVTSEALANVAKHAHASSVTIAVNTIGHQLVVDIADDGVGGASAAVGSGLVGLRDRVEALNGSLRIDSPVGRGTRIHVEIPCP